MFIFTSPNVTGRTGCLNAHALAGWSFCEGVKAACRHCAAHASPLLVGKDAWRSFGTKCLGGMPQCLNQTFFFCTTNYISSCVGSVACQRSGHQNGGGHSRRHGCLHPARRWRDGGGCASRHPIVDNYALEQLLYHYARLQKKKKKVPNSTNILKPYISTKSNFHMPSDCSCY